MSNIVYDLNRIWLCNANREKITVLNGIVPSSVEFHPQIKAYSELSFTVDQAITIDGIYTLSNGYDQLKPYMYLFLEGAGYFIMEPQSISSNGSQETKSITAYSAEKEFENRDWVGIKINCGTKDSMEYVNTDDSNKEPITGIAINYVTLVNQQNQGLSFLHEILKKMNAKWQIGYVSPELWSAKLPAIEIDSQNLYAVMTSEVAPRMNCLFIFDYLNFTINCYSKAEIEAGSLNGDSLDTGIALNFRNLQNSVEVSVDSDSIFTRFSVQGEGSGDTALVFRDINYGDDRIINLDYFLGEPYMEDTTVQRFRRWETLRETYRSNYKELAMEYNVLNEKLNERYNRVPSDQSKWLNWTVLNREALLENLQYYNTLLQTLQMSVDNRPDSVKFNSNNEYVPKTTGGKVDHEWYENLLYQNMDVYSGYYTYCEIVKYILPYIDIALSNIGKTEDEKEVPIIDISTDWELYGKRELEGVKESYQNKLNTVLKSFSKSWDQMSEQERIECGLSYIDDPNGLGTNYENSDPRKEYKLYLARLGSASTPGTILYQLKKLDDEIAAIEAEMQEITKKTNAYNKIMQYDITEEELYDLEDTLDDSTILNVLHQRRTASLFDEDELIIINSLLRDTDYVNTNILTTSIMSLSQKFAAEEELYEDAVDKLSETSQPQYKFSVNLDNFFHIEDFREWTKEFVPNYSTTHLGLLKFIRLYIRDEYMVKVRVIGYRWNPYEVTPDLTLEFSNMITSRSGRSDLTELLETENNRASKNSIRIGNGTAESAQEYCEALMELLQNNSIFLKTVQNISSNTTGVTDNAAVEALVSKAMQNMQSGATSGVYIGDIKGTDEQFQDFFDQQKEHIVTKIIEADKAVFDEIAAQYITAQDIEAVRGKFEQLFSKIINADSIIANSANFNTLVSDAITANTIISKLGNFDALYANQAFVEHFNTLSSSVVAQTVQSETVIDLIARQITVDKLFGNQIVLSDSLHIVSESGDMAMTGDALQIWGTRTNELGENEKYVAIELGYNSSHEIPRLLITDERGRMLFTSVGMINPDDQSTIPPGITAEAISDGLIVNDMVQQGTLDLDRLSSPVMVANEYGGISINQIYTDANGTKFGVEYTTFRDTVNSELANLRANSEKVDIIGENVFKVINNVYSPELIILTAKTTNEVKAEKWYIDGVQNTTYVSADKQSLTIPASEMKNKSRIVVKVECKNSGGIYDPNIYDVFTVYKVMDGDSTPVVIINSSKGNIFKSEDTTTLSCTVYLGVNTITPNSYAWYTKADRETEWTLIGNEPTLIVNIDDTKIKRLYKCSVDID